MEQPRPGRIVTFHSFDGGTGRSMALVNVAWILAAAGKKVLVVDWDLESPSLHRFLEPVLDVEMVMRRSGVIDMLREYEDGIVHHKGYTAEEVRQLASVDFHAITVEWEFRGEGRLRLLPAGRQNTSYAATLGERDWNRFYEELDGAAFLDALSADMRSGYEYTLIDSRSGRGDTVDVCTQHLPDVLVVCHSLSNQSIDGAVRTARAVETFARRGEPAHSIRILPVPMRVDTSLPTRADVGRRVAQRALTGLPRGVIGADRARYFAAVEIPYRAVFAFEETLAVFADVPGDPQSLLAAYERLTDAITAGEVSALAPMSDDERLRVLHRFARTTPATGNDPRGCRTRTRW